jgi:hypothetical protein
MSKLITDHSTQDDIDHAHRRVQLTPDQDKESKQWAEDYLRSIITPKRATTTETTTRSQITSKVLTASRNVSVGIYDNCTNTIRCYPDRTIARLATVRWTGNTGTLDYTTIRVTGRDHEIIRAALADDAVNTAWAIVSQQPR